ncbi:unnamed protein product [Lota lota]
MSDKPRVYQGVRVKTTVKELLQRHRAREADDKDLAVSQSCMDIPSLCVGLSTIQSKYRLYTRHSCVAHSTNSAFASIYHYVDATVMQADAVYSVQQQGNNVYYQQHQYVDGILPATNGYGADIGGNGTILTPSAFPSLPGAQGQFSPEADYYNGMAASSSPDSVKFSSPVDHNSYSPQHSSYSSSSSSSCYDSPTRVDPGHHGFPAVDHCHYQHCTFTDCYCQLQPHCWPAQQESFCAAAEYASYYGPTTTTDYSCAYPADNFKRDFPILGSDMCYNIL